MKSSAPLARCKMDTRPASGRRYAVSICPIPIFRNSGLGFFTASDMLDPYYVVTLIHDFSAFSFRAAANICSRLLYIGGNKDALQLMREPLDYTAVVSYDRGQLRFPARIS